MADSVKPPVKAVALDFDGVITNLDVNWDEAIRQASIIAGNNLKSLILFYENNYGTPLFSKISGEMEKIELEAIKKAQPKPFLQQFLEKVCNAQCPVYVVSMQSQKVVQTFLQQHKLERYFTELITRERCPSKKAQVELISKQTGFRAEEILLVDDSKRNVGICRELGIVCFLFDRKQNPKATKEAWNKVLELLKIENLIF
jgi:beta-phosphoglucomutase-like phosphatase (HAD superfamily)